MSLMVWERILIVLCLCLIGRLEIDYRHVMCNVDLRNVDDMEFERFRRF